MTPVWIIIVLSRWTCQREGPSCQRSWSLHFPMHSRSFVRCAFHVASFSHFGRIICNLLHPLTLCHLDQRSLLIPPFLLNSMPRMTPTPSATDRYTVKAALRSLRCHHAMTAPLTQTKYYKPWHPGSGRQFYSFDAKCQNTALAKTLPNQSFGFRGRIVDF